MSRIALAALALAGVLFVIPLSGELPAGGLSYERPLSQFPALFSRRVEILFAGDMMFDRSVRHVMETEGENFVLSCIKDVLADADFAVANLEGPITPYPSMSVGSVIDSVENVTFTFPPSVAELLAQHNILFVNLGNNHIMNFGLDGLRHTKRLLAEANVLYFGDPEAKGAERVARVEVNDIPFSFVSWDEWTAGSSDDALAQVHAEKEAGRIVVVYTHWGDEYVPPPERVRQLGRRFVEAGAALIVGSHPHIVQEEEEYLGIPIYYSLGNFIFDQYWDDAVREGLLIKVVFSKHGVEAIEEIPVRLERNRRTCPLN